MQQDGRTDLTAHEARVLSRREFVRTLSAAAGSGALLTSAFAGCSLTSSQKAEAAEAMVDNLGKLPKVKLSKRLGGMEISRVVWCQDNSNDLLAPALAAGMNFVHKAFALPFIPKRINSPSRSSTQIRSVYHLSAFLAKRKLRKIV